MSYLNGFELPVPKTNQMVNLKIFANLPVKGLDKSITFFKSVGFSFNPQFTDKTAACLVMSEGVYAMLLTHDKVKQFTKKQIADAIRPPRGGSG